MGWHCTCLRHRYRRLYRATHVTALKDFKVLTFSGFKRRPDPLFIIGSVHGSIPFLPFSTTETSGIQLPACGSMILASVFTDGEPVELFHQFHSYCLLSPMPVFYLSKNDKIKIIGRSPLYTADIFTQINN